MWCSLIFQLKRKSSHDNIQIVTVSWVLIRTQYSWEYFLYLRCQHFNVMHFFYTSCLPCILKLAKNQLKIIFLLLSFTSSHLTPRYQSQCTPSACRTSSNISLSRNPRVPCCVRLIITYYHSLNRNRCYGSWWLRTHRNIREFFSSSWHSHA